MSTKEQIIQLADALIREKGYNAFSFSDISDIIGIKKASIHYHFPQKIDLGVAVIDYHITNINKIKKSCEAKSPIEKFDAFLAIYSSIKRENKVCIVGSLTTDYNTLDQKMIDHLKMLVDTTFYWVISFLKEGKDQGLFFYAEEPKTKATLIISNMIAGVQLAHLIPDSDFYQLQQAIKEELLNKKK